MSYLRIDKQKDLVLKSGLVSTGFKTIFKKGNDKVDFTIYKKDNLIALFKKDFISKKRAFFLISNDIKENQRLLRDLKLKEINIGIDSVSMQVFNLIHNRGEN